MPPRLTIQYGVLVTSASLAGSQYPTTKHGHGAPAHFVLLHILTAGTLSALSPLLLKYLVFPIDNGKIQLQHISLIGFVNLPTHGVALTFGIKKAIINKLKKIILTDFFNAMLLLTTSLMTLISS